MQISVQGTGATEGVSKTDFVMFLFAANTFPQCFWNLENGFRNVCLPETRFATFLVFRKHIV